MTKPSDLVKKVYWEHIDRFGEPSQSYRYDNPPTQEGADFPAFIDVIIWVPNEELNITTFATIGMSDKPMKGVDYRAELHMAVEGELDEATSGEMTRFLANLSLYPFSNNTYFDWWHTLPNAGVIPGFTSTQSILLHPAFVANGWDIICTEWAHVKILNVIPITKEEQLISKNQSVKALLDYMQENNISYFKRR